MAEAPPAGLHDQYYRQVYCECSAPCCRQVEQSPGNGLWVARNHREAGICDGEVVAQAAIEKYRLRTRDI